MQEIAKTLKIIRPDDWHLHLRDGELLRVVLPHTSRQFARAIVMPNLQPPITTVALAHDYKQRILRVDETFRPLMTIYLTDNTPVSEVIAAKESGDVYAFKLYPAGATTNSDAGVTDLLANCKHVLEKMQELGLPLLVHGEVTDPDVDIFDREAIFIDRKLIPLRKAFPALKIVFEHITTCEGAQYVRDSEDGIGATITPQHLLYNRNSIFVGGVRPHYYCLPILKREKHRMALMEAATSGNARFFLGTDSAPHYKDRKESSCGCAGCYSAYHAMELYATAFESANALDMLEGFASIHGPSFYGLPVNSDYIELEKVINTDYAQTIPQVIEVEKQKIVPLGAGETLLWRVAHNA
ncbi:dihydroorotase [Taylorella equigenitalis]|uniref:dihydroorotase n=1 Tax=Taylorella equigenitalis TaxID=29575 RepID=UPI000405D095|nr:dihydroorotase [Taylorella equigenitalis]ASY37473.1 dihydroorotase [Taylorella equigenitalis]KGK33040.1 dihydroorotase [Taylorella equigenitalis]RBA26209.1 dihydroorotase [Taylorella equigenitalis]WDU48244.1 dihydroorotase [Taylorella equigenitalis]